MKITSRSRRERIIANLVPLLLLAGLCWSVYLVVSAPLGLGTLLHLAFAAFGVYALNRVAGRRVRSYVNRLLIPVRLRQAGRRNRRSMTLPRTRD